MYETVKRGGNFVKGKDMWRVGFHVDAMSSISWMSGLVDIHETRWLPKQEALVFVVTNKDCTGTLFHRGELRACSIEGYDAVPRKILEAGVCHKKLLGGGN